MIRKTMAAIAAFVIVAASTQAEAKHRHRHHHTVKQTATIAHVCPQYSDGRMTCYQTQNNERATVSVSRKRHRQTAPIDANGSPTYAGGLITKARAYNGMTAGQIGLKRHTQWCAAFLRYIGVSGPVDDRAISFLKLPHVSPQVGAIAVFPHHVGIIVGFDGKYPIIISGNSNGRRVYEGVYPRIPIAYVSPA